MIRLMIPQVLSVTMLAGSASTSTTRSARPLECLLRSSRGEGRGEMGQMVLEQSQMVIQAEEIDMAADVMTFVDDLLPQLQSNTPFCDEEFAAKAAAAVPAPPEGGEAPAEGGEAPAPAPAEGGEAPAAPVEASETPTAPVEASETPTAPTEGDAN